MDKTKEYILQCEKAEELQHTKLQTGDFVWLGKEYLRIPDSCRVITDPDYAAEHLIWLPRQDQLQKIYLDNRKYKINCGQMSMFFEDWRHEELMRYGRDLIKFSMEQLWLAFVMKKKYNKIWNGKDWEVKSGSGK